MSEDGTNAKTGVRADSSGVSNIYIKANYDGTLTAVYNKKNMIYFNNTLGWEDVWVYFYTSNKYWAEGWGTGAWRGQYFTGDRPYYDMHRGHMTQIEGTDIWYFDYTALGWGGWANVAFTNMGDQSGQCASADAKAPDNDHAYFSNTTDNPIQVVRRGDHKTTLPMFVPLTGQTGTLLNNNKANYVNQGCWMNYPENTGYVLHIYNSKTHGVSDELMSIPFEFNEDKTMPMSLTVELAGGKEYGFEIHRADGNNYGTDTKVMKNGDSGDDGAGWALAENKRTGLLTSVAGDYTFTLNFGNSGGGYNFLAGVHYPVAANDYRVVYNDRVAWSQGTAHSASWYHPSRAINKKDGAEDIVSFYVSKAVGASASMKFQYASAVDGDGVVTWSDVDGGSIDLSDIEESGVYNFYLSQAAGSITVDSIRPYTGQYYIRSQAVTGGWDNYRVGSDHKMTYSEFSESAANTFGEKFSHYKAKWCPRNTNIAFTIANDYSMCITDTLKQDVGNPYSNTDAEGTLNNDGNALYTATDISDKARWKITISGADSTATIRNLYFTERYLMYNSSNNGLRFACYKGTQKPVYLYKKYKTPDTDAIFVIRQPEQRVVKGIYNLQGQRVEHPTRGIYIKNGRKYIIK